MNTVNFLIAHGTELAIGVTGLLSAALAVALIIPGDHPDKELQAAVDFLVKFSRK